MDISHIPMVSVILPVRNEVVYIARSLHSILMQDYPAQRLEILVVDGQSRDGSREVVQRMADQQKRFPIYLFDNPKLITPAALNIGICHARGEIIIRVDGHCEIKSDYVRRCVEHLQREAVDGVGGAIVTVGDTYLARAIADATSSSFGVGNSLFRLRRVAQVFSDSVPFPAYRRDIFKHVGFFDEEMLCNEDDEFNYRVREMGGRILLTMDIHSHYFCRESLSALSVQYFRFGLWKIRVMQKHPRQMSLRQFVPPLFVLALFGSILLALFPLSRSLSLVIPLVYIFTNLLASLYTAIRYDLQTLPVLPFVFVTIHLSYGLGFLAGLIKFANLWGKTEVEKPVFQSEHEKEC